MSPSNGNHHPATLFRKEAIAAHERPLLDGDLLRLSPRWVGRTWQLVAISALLAALYAVMGRITEYAEGPLVIELDGRLVESAITAGTVGRVRVRPGERVEQDQVLVELRDAVEQAELARIERAFELSLLDLLRDPTNVSASASLVQLRSERQLAAARIDERTVRASHAGIVGDVLVREGERVEPGHPVVSILGEGDRAFVTVVLPGRFGPLLEPDTPVFVELTGFRGTELAATIVDVGDAVVGPEQVARALGAELGGSIIVPRGPSLIVSAVLPSRTFGGQGKPLYFQHGMTGIARVPVRTKSLLFTLFPALDPRG